LLDQVARGKRARVSDVAGRFGVTEKTVRRDIAELKERGLIEFVGPLKTGAYRIRISALTPRSTPGR
jgi:Mn-dependent DtxR family transcriptional regulator